MRRHRSKSLLTTRSRHSPLTAERRAITGGNTVVIKSLTSTITYVNNISATVVNGNLFMPQLGPISVAESVIMEALWKRSPLSAEDVLAAVGDSTDWQESTVKTLLNRLLKKRAIRARKQGRRYLYTPILARDQWLLQESSGLLDRLFGGRVAPLVAHFSQHRKLSERDVQELRKLLERIDHV